MERLEEAQAASARSPRSSNAIEKEGAALLADPRRGGRGDRRRSRRPSQAERETLAGELPADLLALYDRLRAQLGGVGVGALQHGRCGGCQLNVGAADLARMADGAERRGDAVRGVQPDPGPHAESGI